MRMIGIGDSPRIGRKSLDADGVGEDAAKALELPSLDQLRRGSAAMSVLDRVLYGPPNPDSEVLSESSRIRRDIVAVSLRIVAEATRDEPDIPTSPLPVHTDKRLWTDRFGELAESVDCATDEAALTARVLAQCASAPTGLDRLVSVMAAVATANLIAIDGLARAIRAHLIEAAVCADIAWCAAHGQLADCPSWRKAERDGESAILVRLRRFLPPEPQPDPDADSGLGDLATAVGFQAAPPTELATVPAPLLELVGRLLRDGRWPTQSQRRIAAETRRRLVERE